MSGPPANSARTLAGSAGGTINTPEYIPLLIDAKAAASMLSIGARTLWSLTNCSAVPSRRIGRAVRYSPDELRAWIAGGCPREPGSADRVRAAMRKGGWR